MLNYPHSMIDNVFDIDKTAVIHYRYRLELLITEKKNIEIKHILEEQLKPKLDLLEEIIECHNTKNEKQRTEQWERYKIPICKALLLFTEDIAKGYKIMSEFGSEKIKLSTRETDDFLKMVDRRLSSFMELIEGLERSPQYSSF